MPTQGPSPQDQRIIALLTSIQKQMKALNTTAGSIVKNKTKGNTKYTKSVSKLGDELEQLEKKTGKLYKTFSNSEKELRKSAYLFNRSLTDMVTDAIKPGSKMVRKTMLEWRNTFDDMVRSQSRSYKDLAQNTRDYILNNKNALGTMKVATDTFKDLVGSVRGIARQNRIASKEDVARINDFRKFVNTLNSTAKIDLYKNLSPQQMNMVGKIKPGMLLTNKEFRELANVIHQINNNFSVMTDVTDSYVKGITKATDDLKTGFKDALKSFFGNMKNAFAAMIPQTLSDIQEQTQNAVKTSNYSQAILGALGVSEGELAQFQGQNRLVLREIGNGKANAPIENGTIAQLQNVTRNLTGLSGNDALKYLGNTLQTIVNTGITLTSQNVVGKVTQQMTSLKDTMQRTGMSFDQLQETVSDLSTSPAFLDIIRAHGYSSMQEEVKILASISTSTKFSMDYLKDILELNKQAKYQGIGEIIKAQIGTKLETGLLNQYGARISTRDEQLMERLRGGASEKNIFNSTINGKSVSKMFGSVGALHDHLLRLATQYATSQVNITNKLSELGGGAPLGIFNTLQSIFGDMMGAPIFNHNEAIAAQVKRKGMFGGGEKNQVANIMGANDALVYSVNQVDNAFTEAIQKYFPQFNGTLLRIEGILKSWGKNPAGQASGFLGNVVHGLVEAGVDVWALKKIIGKTPGAIVKSAGRMGFSRSLGLGARVLGKTLRIGGPLALGLGTAIGSGSLTRGFAVGGGAYAGGELGAALGMLGGPLAPVTIPVGALIGMGLGGLGGNKLVDWVDKWGKHNHGATGQWGDAWQGSAGMMGPTSTTFKPPDPDTITPDTPLTPQGDTVGDFWKDNNTKLSQLITVIQKILDTMEEEHKEYMEYQATKNADLQQKIAHQGGLNALTTSH